MRRPGLAALLLLSSCGADPGPAHLPLGIAIHGLAPESIARVQIAVLANGQSFLCGEITKTCLRSQVEDSALVPIRGEDGRDLRAVRLAVDTAQLLGSKGQTFTVSIPAGTHYMVVAEVLSVEAKLLASGCGVLAEVAGGDDNPAMIIQARAPATAPACDPRIDG